MKKLLQFLNPLRISGMVTLGLVVLLTAVSCFVYFTRRPRDQNYQLRLSTGRKIEPEKSITRFFKRRAGDHGLKFEMVSTDGSEDSLARIQRGELDLAVIK